LEQALADYDQAIALDPQYAAAYNNRGIAYANLGDLEQAIADYDQALALDPQDALAYNNRGNAYRTLGDLEQAIALDPQYAQAYYNRGIAYYDLDDLEQAIADFRRCLELAPNAPNRAQIEAGIQDLQQQLNQPN
jgi:tetratricopeptide (TPR) repeat protein